jgi:type I restriction-modification system DNA methylase subunit
MKKLLVDEIAYVTSKMETEEEPVQKLFHFSGIFGLIQRIYNLEYDPDLVFAHFVLSEIHKIFNARIHAIRDARDTVVPLWPDQFEKLTNACKELAKRVEKDKNFDQVLKDLVILAYTTTGNGYYLFEKGVLKI